METTIEEKAKHICVDVFCCKCPKRVCTNCIWCHNTERAQPQCCNSEYKEAIKDVYHVTIAQLKAQRAELTRWNDPKEEFNEDNSIGIEFNKFNAVMYAKGCLVERLRNDPNAGMVKIEEFEYE